jgi:hypothetical protein
MWRAAPLPCGPAPPTAWGYVAAPARRRGGHDNSDSAARGAAEVPIRRDVEGEMQMQLVLCAQGKREFASPKCISLLKLV